MPAEAQALPTRVHARCIFDSRGRPTVEVEVDTAAGTARASVPSGASCGRYEAHELRDNDSRYLGAGVDQAVRNVNQVLGPALISSGLAVTQQAEVDALLCKTDGTPDKRRLGANAVLGVSLAVARAGAQAAGVPLHEHLAALSGAKRPARLPVPFLNVINGGRHAGNRLVFQEFMLVPQGADTMREALQWATEAFQHLRTLVAQRYGPDAVHVGDEGGFAPPIHTVEEALDLLQDAITASGHRGRLGIAMDCAASEFCSHALYDLDAKARSGAGGEHRVLTGRDMVSLYTALAERYPALVSLEDPLDQDDWESWTALCAQLPPRVQVVADDLTATNCERLQLAVQRRAASCLLLKVNQIGTLSEAFAAARMAFDAGWGVQVSHRSGETEDAFIADLAVALGCGQLKCGAPCRSERVAKLNQLLRIEDTWPAIPIALTAEATGSEDDSCGCYGSDDSE